MPSLLSRLARTPPTPDGVLLHASVITTALDAVPSFCDVVTAHVNDVIEHTDEAAHSLVHQLAAVDEQAEAMAGDIRELAATLSRTEEQLATVGSSNGRLVEQLIRYFLHRDEQIRRLVEEMRGLSQHVAAIEQVSKATNILALNAMIEAVRAGDAGPGFAVVADEVRKLARRSATAANGIGESIADLTNRLDTVLSDDTQGDPAELPELDFTTAQDTTMTRRLADIATAQREMADLVEGILHDTVQAAEKVQRSSDALTASTTGAVGHVQFQDISRQMLEHVTAAVDDVRKQTEDVIGYVQGDVDGDVVLGRVASIDDLRDRHVMSRQRASHASSTEGGDSSADGDAGAGPEELAIELF